MDESPELALKIALEDQQRRSQANAQWDAEYNFWHKIISEEVERLRFNEGYEPVDIELYETGEKYGPAYIGKTQVGRTLFHVTGRLSHDKLGRKILKIEVRKAS